MNDQEVISKDGLVESISFQTPAGKIKIRIGVAGDPIVHIDIDGQTAVVVEAIPDLSDFSIRTYGNHDGAEVEATIADYMFNSALEVEV